MTKIIATLTVLFGLSSVCLASTSGTKVIYGDDNRVDVIDSTNSLFVKLSQSTAAMIPNNKVQEYNNEQVLLGGTTLSERGMCKTERFANQPTTANCSGFLVGKNLLVTAGHCIKNMTSCSGSKWVFDFKVDQADQSEVIVDKSNVYSCKKIISQELSSNKMDYALIELDRDVQDREVLKFRTEGKIKVGTKLVVIGHPTGLPTKIADGASVRNVNSVYFQANLDTYGGNSGSAVFNAETGIIEGILVRGDTDYVYSGGCRASNRIGDNAGRGEDVTLITNVKGLPTVSTPPTEPQDPQTPDSPEEEDDQEEELSLWERFLRWLRGE